MKTIKVIISNDISVDVEINNLLKRIPDTIIGSQDFPPILNQIKSCIQDFSCKANKLSKIGTTIHIKKEFLLHGLIVQVILDYPKKISFFDKIKKIIIK